MHREINAAFLTHEHGFPSHPAPDAAAHLSAASWPASSAQPWAPPQDTDVRATQRLTLIHAGARHSWIQRFAGAVALAAASASLWAAFNVAAAAVAR